MVIKYAMMFMDSYVCQTRKFGSLPKISKMFMSPAGILCGLANINKKQGFAIRFVEHSISEEFGSVCDTTNMSS